jgi:3D (Asp-Asp-Asp) domain-containing protein
MNTSLKHRFLLTLVAALMSLPLGAQAQTDSSMMMEAGTPTPTPAPSSPASQSSAEGQSGKGPGQYGPMAQLGESERAQLKAAHDAAIQKDPSLEQGMEAARQAMEKARKAMNDAMIAVDPSVEPILAKIAPPKRGGGPGPGRPPGGQAGQGTATNAVRPWKHDGPGPKGMANLNESERQQLKALHEQVKNDPSVIAAREARKAATTPEARKEAEQAMHQAVRNAVIAVDPSVAPILEKLHPDGDEGRSDGGQQTNAGSGAMQNQ